MACPRPSDLQLDKRDMMKILLLISALLFGAATASAQRCGDSLLIFLRDRDGKVIAPSEFELAKVSATYTVDNVVNLTDAEPRIKELAHGVKSFSVRAECGIKAVQFQFKYRGGTMTVRVLNVTGDAQHILLEGILFRSGTYEVDLGNRPMKNVEGYTGPESRMDDPADEIRWAIKDASLRKVG
jgi:hypothetical protein